MLIVTGLLRVVLIYGDTTSKIFGVEKMLGKPSVCSHTSNNQAIYFFLDLTIVQVGYK